jgi:hypothetical protein
MSSGGRGPEGFGRPPFLSDEPLPLDELLLLSK